MTKERIFKHKDKQVTTKVRLNATSIVKTVHNRFWHDDEERRVYQHLVECWVDGKPIHSKPCENHELDATIAEGEAKAKEWINQQQPRVDPVEEKLKKMGFT